MESMKYPPSLFSLKKQRKENVNYEGRVVWNNCAIKGFADIEGLIHQRKKSLSEINGKGRKKEKEGASGVLWIAFLERNCHFDDSTLPENKLRLQYSELIDIFILLQQ